VPQAVHNPLLTAARALYRVRRPVATAIAIGLALIFGWHAFFGQNGITAYAQKRAENRSLQTQIEKLTQENATLSDHVDHLQTDADTIEMEARKRLHYTRPGEVIYTLAAPTPQGTAAHAAGR
jgi:cell division protein FtsB